MSGTEGQDSQITQEPASREIVTGPQFSERALALLKDPHMGVLSVLRPDGTMVQTKMWYDLRDDGTILMNTTRFRHKYHHLQQNPSISFLVSGGDYQYVTMNGTVALNDDPETAQRDISHLAERYLGKEEADKIMRDEFAREERVSVILTPTKITEYFSQ